MASINVAEADFEAVAGAALDAKRRGDMVAARGLDKVARKINAALTASRADVSVARKMMGMPRVRPLTWQDMPSVIDT